MKLLSLLAVAALLGGLTLTTTGCSRQQLVRANMTNAADSTVHSDDEDWNNYARVVDHNTRGIWDDLNRLLLLDKPSAMSPYSIPR